MIIIVIQYLLLIILGLPVIYIFVFSIAGLFYRKKPVTNGITNRRIAVLIPGYKEDSVIIETAACAVLQNYPAWLYDVIIIADSFRPATLGILRQLRIKVIEVGFEKSTKAKALNSAMELLPDSYDIAVILDADNIMEPDFLAKINRSFDNDISAVQGHRTAKNLNNRLAILDAASEEINNHIFRKGHRAVGLSSAIIGSGMAFRYPFFREIMSGVTAVGGFDKEIELKMLRRKLKIEYLDNAVVYDEKVQKDEVFSNQRRRWLSAQFYYFRKDFLISVKDLFLKGNLDYFDKAVQFIQPPRILLLVAVLMSGTFFILLNIIGQGNDILLWAWCLLIVACIGSFLFALPRQFYTMKTFKALAGLPKGAFLMAMSFMKIKGANRTFIHTSHTSVSIHDQQ